jgi:lysophospholipase L1-like esterase
MTFARDNPMRYATCAVVLFLCLVLSACGRNPVKSVNIAHKISLDDQQIQHLETKKIFFGHMSVGGNIIEGIRDLMAADPRLKLIIVHSAEPESVPGPAFVEFEVGENGNPQSKNAAFAAILDRGMGSQGGVAMFKYCYVDIDASTNVQQMFDSYRAEITALRQKYPRLQFVHITVPLTTAEPAPKAWVKTLLGRTTVRAINAKRNEFNKLLYQAYAGIDPIFDLAEVESTHSDGSRSYFMRGDERIYTMAPELTTDGGHLNEAGRRAAAAQLLLVLAKV